MRASNAAKIASALANVPLDSLAPHRFTGFFYFDLKRVARCDLAIKDCIMLTDAIISRFRTFRRFYNFREVVGGGRVRRGISAPRAEDVWAQEASAPDPSDYDFLLERYIDRATLLRAESLAKKWGVPSPCGDDRKWPVKRS